jgi:hypothetical protein
MSKRAVFITAIVLLGLTIAAVIYSIAAPDQIPFDHRAWTTASSDAEYAQRNLMINDVEKQIDNGTLHTEDAVREALGNPDSSDDQSSTWYYFLGSPGGQTSNRRLEIAFDKSGRVISRRVIAE